MTPSAKLIWLIRHGETEWSLSGAHTGRTDIPLTPRGRDSAQCLIGYLGKRQFAAVFTSPLRRARDTSRIAGYPDAIVEPDLAEWDYGKYEGRKTDEIRQERQGWSIWKDGAEGGESIEEVGQRAQRVISRALAMEGDVALFGHGHILRILGACWVGLPPASGSILGLDTAAVSALGFERETRVIRLWNRSPQDDECSVPG